MIHNRSSTPAAAQVPQDGTQQGTDPPRLPSFHPDMSPLCCILLAATLLQLQERALSLYVPLRPATPTVPYRQRRNHAAAPRPICMASGSGLGGDEESKNFLQSLLGDDYELVNSGMSYEEEVLGYDAGIEDEEVLRDIRMNKMIVNDRWQSCHFRDNQGGEWTGSYETYQCAAGTSAGVSLRKVGSGTVRSTMSAGEFSNEGVSIFINEVYVENANSNSNALDARAKQAAEMLQKPTRESFKPTDFRIIAGNQIIANAFTLNSVSPSGPVRDPLAVIEEIKDFIPDHYIGEIGVREGPIRTRVRFAYAAGATTALSADEKSSFPLGLVGMTVIREAQLSASPADVQLLLDSKTGPGIYDPQAGGEPYVQLNMPGRLSLLFPRGVLAGSRQCLTIEWEGTAMRYQADRKFSDLTGAVASLELTEVRAAEADKYRGGF